MTRSSIRYIDVSGRYSNTGEEISPVVYGRFPKRISMSKPSVADKINAFLSVMLLLSVGLSLVSYYFVSDSEKTMNKLRREIVSLNNENLELQNKLDNLHSFNKVEQIIQGKTSLDAAKKVIEVPESGAKPVQAKKETLPVNYNWFMGY